MMESLEYLIVCLLTLVGKVAMLVITGVQKTTFLATTLVTALFFTSRPAL